MSDAPRAKSIGRAIHGFQMARPQNARGRLAPPRQRHERRPLGLFDEHLVAPLAHRWQYRQDQEDQGDEQQPC
jgi:hypothetical protein